MCLSLCMHIIFCVISNDKKHNPRTSPDKKFKKIHIQNLPLHNGLQYIKNVDFIIQHAISLMLFKKISHIAKIEFLEPFMIICLQLVDRYVKNTIVLTQMLPAT